jgi:hypothetical protein
MKQTIPMINTTITSVIGKDTPVRTGPSRRKMMRVTTNILPEKRNPNPLTWPKIITPRES